MQDLAVVFKGLQGLGQVGAHPALSAVAERRMKQCNGMPTIQARNEPAPIRRSADRMNDWLEAFDKGSR
jgi:hypothetical protein